MTFCDINSFFCHMLKVDHAWLDKGLWLNLLSPHILATCLLCHQLLHVFFVADRFKFCCGLL